MFKHHSEFHTEEKGREIKKNVCFHDNCEMMAWIDRHHA